MNYLCHECDRELMVEKEDTMLPGSNDPVIRFAPCVCPSEKMRGEIEGEREEADSEGYARAMEENSDIQKRLDDCLEDLDDARNQLEASVGSNRTLLDKIDTLKKCLKDI